MDISDLPPRSRPFSLGFMTLNPSRTIPTFSSNAATVRSQQVSKTFQPLEVPLGAKPSNHRTRATHHSCKTGRQTHIRCPDSRSCSRSLPSKSSLFNQTLVRRLYSNHLASAQINIPEAMCQWNWIIDPTCDLPDLR